MELKQIFEGACEQATGEQKNFRVEFYPYASLKHTIRERRGEIIVRLSDACRDASMEIFEAIAAILIAKLRRRKIPRQHWHAYKSFISGSEMQKRCEELRKKRGQQMLSGSAGKCYDLEEVFERLNKSYFNGELRKPKLSWSAKKARVVLGRWESALDAIVVSRLLDDPRVPGYVLDYIVYHEMLHAKQHNLDKLECRRTLASNFRRRVVHSQAFKREERKFADYERARVWLRGRWK